MSMSGIYTMMGNGPDRRRSFMSEASRDALRGASPEAYDHTSNITGAQTGGGRMPHPFGQSPLASLKELEDLARISQSLEDRRMLAGTKAESQALYDMAMNAPDIHGDPQFPGDQGAPVGDPQGEVDRINARQERAQMYEQSRMAARKRARQFAATEEEARLAGAGGQQVVPIHPDGRPYSREEMRQQVMDQADDYPMIPGESPEKFRAPQTGSDSYPGLWTLPPELTREERDRSGHGWHSPPRGDAKPAADDLTDSPFGAEDEYVPPPFQDETGRAILRATGKAGRETDSANIEYLTDELRRELPVDQQLDLLQRERNSLLIQERDLKEGQDKVSAIEGGMPYRDPDMPSVTSGPDGWRAAAEYNENRRRNQNFAQGNPGLSAKFGPGGVLASGGVDLEEQYMSDSDRRIRSESNAWWRKHPGGVLTPEERVAQDARRREKRDRLHAESSTHGVYVDSKGAEVGDDHTGPKYQISRSLRDRLQDDDDTARGDAEVLFGQIKKGSERESERKDRLAEEYKEFGMSKKDYDKNQRYIVQRNRVARKKNFTGGARRAFNEDTANRLHSKSGDARLRTQRKLKGAGYQFNEDGTISGGSESESDPFSIDDSVNTGGGAARQDTTRPGSYTPPPNVAQHKTPEGKFSSAAQVSAEENSLAQAGDPEQRGLLETAGIADLENPVEMAMAMGNPRANEARTSFRQMMSQQLPSQRGKISSAIARHVRNAYVQKSPSHISGPDRSIRLKTLSGREGASPGGAGFNYLHDLPQTRDPFPSSLRNVIDKLFIPEGEKGYIGPDKVTDWVVEYLKVGEQLFEKSKTVEAGLPDLFFPLQS